MSRIRLGALIGLIALSGCTTRPEEYVEAARAQRKAIEQIRNLLADIKDEKDMQKAKEELDRRFDAFEEIARKAQALPKPPPPEALSLLEDETRPSQRAVDGLIEEIQRVRALPGGERFFEQYQPRPLLGRQP